ncbi:hypothetical protein ACQ4PT_033626 [Festuca glaucescens]
MTAAMEIEVSAEDVAYEEDVLRDPFRLSGWLRYLSSLRAAPPAKRAAIYERAMRALPGSYKLWHAYLTELADAARALPVTHRAHADVNAAFERALAAGMSRMPRVWHIWRDAAEHLASAINDDGFVSVKGTTKRQLLLDLCGLLSQHPEEVAGMPVDAILRGSIREFPDKAGVLWTCLAGHYARPGLHGKARDVFEEGVRTATTVKDFRMVFDAYVHFEHAVAAAELAQADTVDIQDFWLADRDGMDLTVARLERLLERRPELLNGELLRQNPHDVQAWHERAKIFRTDPARHAATYVEALRTVDPAKATGKPPHTLWLALAKIFEDRGRVECARDVFERATQAKFTAPDHLAAVYCEWANMELRQPNPDRAMDIIRQATSEPSVEVTRCAGAGVGGEPVQMKLHRSLKLWIMYLDLTRTHGSLESTCAVYDRMHDLGPANAAAGAGPRRPSGGAREVYEDAATAVPAGDRLGVYEVYVARAMELYGVLKARDVYYQAIHGGGLPDEDATAMCVRFADLEVVLGEVARARTLYVYAASFTNPEVRPGFWKRWNDFEHLHSDESTFREMLRIKRTAAASAGASVIGSAGAAVAEMDDFRAAPKRLVRACAGQQLGGASIAQQCKRTRLV